MHSDFYQPGMPISCCQTKRPNPRNLYFPYNDAHHALIIMSQKLKTLPIIITASIVLLIIIIIAKPGLQAPSVFDYYY